MKDIVEKILAEHHALKSLPQTLAEVLRVVKDDRSSAQDLSDALIRDPALTAKVLRVVNSPYYGMQREVSSMQHAVQTIGTRQVTALALSSSIYSMSNDWGGNIDRIRFWRHCLETAICSRMIAEAIGFEQPEDAFVSGLLHDIGLLVMEKSFPEDCQRIRKFTEQGESMIDLEDEAWGTNHARVGQFMLEQWNIPQSVCTAVGHHHDLFAPETTNPEIALSQIVTLANLMSTFTIDKGDHNCGRDDVENQNIICENLALPSTKLTSIQKELMHKTVEEAKYLEIDIGSSEELLIESNARLFDQYLTLESLLKENRKLQQQITHDRMRQVAGDSLRNIAIKLNQHINNATGALTERAQQIRSELNTTGACPPGSDVDESIQVIIEGVAAVGSVMKDLSNLACLDSASDPDSDGIADVEEKLKEQIGKFEIVEMAS